MTSIAMKVFGVLALVSGAIAHFMPGTNVGITAGIVTSVASGLIGLFGRQNSVSSETAGAK